MTGPPPPRTLSAEHEALLSAAAITPDIAQAAGVYTATEEGDLPAELADWAPAALPGIVFRWDPVAGGAPLYQLRPDRPIPKADGTGHLKYVFPIGAQLCFAVHPLMRERVADPTTPIVVVEGTKQTLAGVAALASSDYAVVGMSGCYGWSQHNEPIPDLRAVPWSRRDVYLVFDADITTNRDVWEAAQGLKGWLDVAGAASVKLVKLPGGARSGLDDVLAVTAEPIEAMARLLAGATTKMPRRPARRRSGEFFDEDGSLLADKSATALLEEHPCALAADGTVAVYDAGRYVVEKDSLMTFVADMLGDRHRPIHTVTITQVVISKLMIERKRLTDRQRGGLLNVRNGMLDLMTGELHSHSPSYMSVAQLPVEWDPDATCPTYDRWLPQVCSAEQIEDLEEVTSTMLDPSRTPHKSLFLFGPSRSGKSTFLRIMRALAGIENTSGVTLHQLAEDRFSTANLYGKSLNVAADLSSRHVEDLSVWKMLTGEDLISANLKYGRMFTFTNQALFAFSANEPPTVSETSRAYFDRIKPVKFDHSFAGEEDPTLEETIIERELAGVLARWRRAFVRLRERRQFRPTNPAVQADFEVASDRVRLWVVEEMQVIGNYEGDRPNLSGSKLPVPGANLPASLATPNARLYELFTVWAKENGYSALGKQKFLRRLTSLDGVVDVRIKPTLTRGLNVIKRVEDHHDGRSTAKTGSFETPSTMQVAESREIDLEENSVTRIGQGGFETACFACELPPAHLPVNVLTLAVYAAIAADPEHATKTKITTELDLSPSDFQSERDYLVSRGVIRRRRGRGFEVLRELVAAPLPYHPLADPSWTHNGSGTPCDRELLIFGPPVCAICGGPDDGTSAYFPLCTFHRQEVPS